MCKETLVLPHPKSSHCFMVLHSAERVAAGELGYHLFKEGFSGRGLLAKAAGICARISAGLEVGAGAS